MLLLMYCIMQDMYVLDCKQLKVVIIDEVWDLMGIGKLGDFIEVGYCRVRKYGGFFFIVMQLVVDYYKLEIVKVVFENVDWMFFLWQKVEFVEMFVNFGKFIMDDYIKMLLCSVIMQLGVFLEVFV